MPRHLAQGVSIVLHYLQVLQLVYLDGCNPMPERVSTIDARQWIGDLLNRVTLRHDEFIIERKGKPLAALVPVERLEQMRRLARAMPWKFSNARRAFPSWMRRRWTWRSKPGAGPAGLPSNGMHSGSAWRMVCLGI